MGANTCNGPQTLERTSFKQGTAPPYLEKYGATVIKNGYNICFIYPREKRPFGDKWQTTKHDHRMVAKAIKEGRGGFGVGIKTKHNPLVDIDCYDEELVEQLCEFVTKRVGDGLKRVGFAPKTGILFKTESPFPKTQSKIFVDDQGRSVKVEVLGNGQQFVAMNIHPDTGKPYRWKDKQHPGIIPRSDLIEITQSDAFAIIAVFERLAREKNWPEKKTVNRLALQSGEVDLNDPFVTDKQPIAISVDELRAKLETVPDSEDYDTWCKVGMALYHQYDGNEVGLVLWHEWSADAINYNRESLDEKWSTFDIEGKGREPISARLILKLASEEEKRIAVEELDDVKIKLSAANDLDELLNICKRIKRTPFQEIIRDSLAPIIRDRGRTISGTSMPLANVRKLIRFENPENQIMPKWVEEYAYCALDEMFFSQKTRMMLSHKAFDATYGRFAMTQKDRLEGRSKPEHTASHLALHRHEIPTVHSRMYLPSADNIFTIGGLKYVNSYTDISIPKVPKTLKKKELWAIEIVKNHIKHMFENERDRRLLLSWIAYIVQTGNRVNWAPILQGTEGDGKSFFYLLMGCMLGGENVKTIPGDALSEKNTAFAEGVQFSMIEEVRLRGHDRYAIINKVKPYITNNVVAIRRMRTDWYDVVNTVNYMMTTNHKDGVPTGNRDTRYFPMFSRWQTQAVLNRFKLDNPNYYEELHEALKYAGALRKWFLEFTLHEEFKPLARAPHSSSRDEMNYINRSDEEDAFLKIMATDKCSDLNRKLIDSSKLCHAMEGLGSSPPRGRALKAFLERLGFTPLGEHKVKGKNNTYWSECPADFCDSHGTAIPQKIRDWIETGWAEDI